MAAPLPTLTTRRLTRTVWGIFANGQSKPINHIILVESGDDFLLDLLDKPSEYWPLLLPILKELAWPALHTSVALEETVYNNDPTWWANNFTLTPISPPYRAGPNTYIYKIDVELPFIASDFDPTVRDPPRSKDLYTSPWPKWPTGRAITYMKELTNPIRLPQAEQEYLPVSRYPGLYYSGAGEYCGKYYYYEPASTTWLGLGKYKVFGSKMGAYLELGRWTEPDIVQNFFDQLLADQPDLATVLPPTDVATGLPQHETWDKLKILLQHFAVTDEGLFYTKIYEPRSYIVPLVADNYDFLDQPLCKLGQAAGLDVLIFQHEAGYNRPVTELLDTRSDSYDYLVSTTNVRDDLPADPNYPAVYYPAKN